MSWHVQLRTFVGKTLNHSQKSGYGFQINYLWSVSCLYLTIKNKYYQGADAQANLHLDFTSNLFHIFVLLVTFIPEYLHDSHLHTCNFDEGAGCDELYTPPTGDGIDNCMNPKMSKAHKTPTATLLSEDIPFSDNRPFAALMLRG